MQQVILPFIRICTTIESFPFLAEQTAISLLSPDMPADSELLKVAIIGSPNAGKSTFVNRLMGWRVSQLSVILLT
jgi:predicted GTPase